MNRRRVLRSLSALMLSPLAGRASKLAATKPQPTDPAPPCPVRAIALNQLGFRPAYGKRAAVVLAVKDAPAIGPAIPFKVVDAATGVTRMEGTVSSIALDAASGDVVGWADFSKFDIPGAYAVEACGKHSDTFHIGDDVYASGLRLTMRSFYGQRCGCKVDLGNGYHHDACHLDAAFHKSSGRQGKIYNLGGWHDAGDYGRYVVNSGISTGTLLWAWELYPEPLRNLKLNIPESGGALPDYLAETKWNLNWMLSLQDEKDGGVWHKQTSEAFCGFIMPEKDKLTSYVIGTGSAPFKSTGATADLAAVAAIASRCFRPFDAAYADRCLAAARKAFTWAMANPRVLFRNPPGVTTGGYGDRNCDDEILWAAAELFRTTGEAEYERAFMQAMPDDVATNAASWGSLAPFAYWAYCMAPNAKRFLKDSLIQTTLDAASLRILRSSQNGYGNTLRMRDYIWGSNGVAGNDAVLLLLAHHLQPNREAVDAALGNLHYLLGCNCFGVSWVTQLGARPFMHPHHRPSGADKIDAPWPGLLSGGPNAGGGDAVANALPKQAPMKMWVDDQRAYSMNEVAINWNAPLVFLLAAANSKLQG